MNQDKIQEIVDTDTMFFLDSLVDLYGLEPDGEKLSISTTHELLEKLEQPLKDWLKSTLEKYGREEREKWASELRVGGERKDIYLFVDNFLQNWGGVFNAEQEYRHIEKTRKTKAQVLKELHLSCVWHEKNLQRTRKAMQIIKEMAQGEEITIQELNAKIKRLVEEK